MRYTTDPTLTRAERIARSPEYAAGRRVFAAERARSRHLSAAPLSEIVRRLTTRPSGVPR